MNNSPKSFWEKATSLLKAKIGPRRFDFIVWTLIIWIIWLRKSDFDQVALSLKFAFPPSFQIILSSFKSPFLLKFVFAAVLSLLANISLDIYVRNYLGMFKEEDPGKIKELLKRLDERAGIKKIYEGIVRCPVIKQDYAKDMMEEVSQTKSIKILSIAGYESIGRGEGESLFYDVLRSRHINLEQILLNPSDDKTIMERIKQVQRQDMGYTDKDLKGEINETIEKLRILKKAKKGDDVNGYYCRFHPVFRLIIFDRSLFMSTYETDRHGHESPVYKIDKVSDLTSDNLSLYDTFANFFEKVRDSSECIEL